MAFGDYRASSGAGAKDTTGTASTLAVAFGANNVAGDILVAGCWFGTGGGSNTFANSGNLTDTQGNGWNPAVATEILSGGTRLLINFVTNCNAGANTVTLHVFSVAPMAIAIAAFDAAGGGSGVTLDGANSHVNGSTAPGATAGSITPTGNGCLIVAMFSNDYESNTWTAGTALAFTIRATAAYPSTQLILESAVQGAAAAVNADATSNNTNDTYNAAVVAFKPVGGGGGGTQPRVLLYRRRAQGDT